MQVEEYVRGALAEEFGQPFAKERLTLEPGGHHEFDAVARDRSVIASIKSASGRTAGGNIPAGKIKDCVAEMYFLLLVRAPTLLLVLTSSEMHEILSRTLRDRVATQLRLMHVPLPPEIQELASAVHGRASAEMFPVLDETEQANLRAAKAAPSP